MSPAGGRARLRPDRWKHPLPLSTRLAMLGAGCAIGWTILGFTVQYVRTYSLAREAAGLERRRQDLLTQNAALLVEIQRLRSDDQYLERLAREELGMLRPGELELVIVPATAVQRPSERDGVRAEAAAADGPWQWAQRCVQRITATLRAQAARLLSPRTPVR